MTGAEALARAVPRLRAAGVDDPAGDARWLLAHALGIDPGRLTLHLPEPLGAAAAARFDAAITARAARQPVSRIIGFREFYGRRIQIGAAVLDPRPETEILVELALSEAFATVLDLGTGSGCILLTLLAEREQAQGCGSDISGDALEIARRNAAALGVADRASLTQSDWFTGISGRYDLIVSNPPYIAQAEMAALAPEVRDHEPALALTPGGDGLDAYRAIAAGAGAHLATGGRLMVETGPTQGEAVARLMRDAGLVAVTVTPDLDGRDRVVSGRKPDSAQ